jgi:hypothetical protein
VAVSVRGRVAVQHRQGGALGEVHTSPVERACRAGGMAEVRVGTAPAPAPAPALPRPHRCGRRSYG